MSPELRTALADWLAWVERGAPEDDENFHRSRGLCIAVRFSGASKLELQDLFQADNLNRDYPFGEFEFYDRADDETMHECPDRLAWVRKMLAVEVAK